MNIWPQVIYLILIGLNLGMGVILHGKPKEGNYSFWNAVLGTAISVAILNWGGFFGPLFNR